MERYTPFNTASPTMSLHPMVFIYSPSVSICKTGSYVPAFGSPASLTQQNHFVSIILHLCPHYWRSLHTGDFKVCTEPS